MFIVVIIGLVLGIGLFVVCLIVCCCEFCLFSCSSYWWLVRLLPCFFGCWMVIPSAWGWWLFTCWVVDLFLCVLFEFVVVDLVGVCVCWVLPFRVLLLTVLFALICFVLSVCCWCAVCGLFRLFLLACFVVCCCFVGFDCCF